MVSTLTPASAARRPIVNSLCIKILLIPYHTADFRLKLKQRIRNHRRGPTEHKRFTDRWRGGGLWRVALLRRATGAAHARDRRDVDRHLDGARTISPNF